MRGCVQGQGRAPPPGPGCALWHTGRPPPGSPPKRPSPRLILSGPRLIGAAPYLRVSSSPMQPAGVPDAGQADGP